MTWMSIVDLRDFGEERQELTISTKVRTKAIRNGAEDIRDI